jgi:hypothetical protein
MRQMPLLHGPVKPTFIFRATSRSLSHKCNSLPLRDMRGEDTKIADELLPAQYPVRPYGTASNIIAWQQILLF